MKFIGVPVRVREANNPFFTPKGTLPVMRDGRKLLTNFEEVVEHLKSLVCPRFLLESACTIILINLYLLNLHFSVNCTRVISQLYISYYIFNIAS